MSSPKKQFTFEIFMLLALGLFQLKTGIQRGLLATPAVGALLVMGGAGLWMARFWGRSVAILALLSLGGLFGWDMSLGSFSWWRTVAIGCMLLWATYLWLEGRHRNAAEAHPLHASLERGLVPGADLAKELHAMGDFKPRTRADLDAVVAALKRAIALPPAKNRFSSPLRTVVGFIQNMEDPEPAAIEVLLEEALPLLHRHLDARMDKADEEEADDLVFILKVAVMCGTRESAELMVRAARLPLQPESYLWTPIFRALGSEHPHRDFVYERLRDHLPPGFIAVSFVDAANQQAIDGNLESHPFDGPAGKVRLREWLNGGDPEHFSYAHSATVALPFIRGPERDTLFALAMDHPDASVQLEAAWASAKLGSEAGFRSLSEYCLDVQQSGTARRYLEELGRKEMIPPEALDPDFKARSDFAGWLAHPNELGRPPDEVEVVESRELRWPPEGEVKRLSVVRYRAKATEPLGEDDVDCGLVGSTTFCLFSMQMNLRPPEDVYAIHCVWELTKDDLVAESEPDRPEEYAASLRQWTGPGLQEARVVRVAELSPKLAYPQPLVAVASAKLGGQEGWAVLDGPRSSWYPKAEQPDEEASHEVLRIHIGRTLLGFSDPPDRVRGLARRAPKRPPAEFCARYEALLGEARRRPNPNLKSQVDSLGSHLEKYAEARSEARGDSKERVFVSAFEDLLALVQADAELFGEKAYDSFGPLGKNIGPYGDALLATGAVARVASLIDLVEPYWDHNLGYGTLGTFAHKAGLNDRAEAFFLKLRGSMERWPECEELDRLARIWHGKGLKADAKGLLLDSLAKLVQEGREGQQSERERLEKVFHDRRRTYLELFPDLGEASLPAWPPS